MKKNNVKYYRSNPKDIEVVYCEQSSISYSKHNHIATYVIGLVLDGGFELEKKDQHIMCHTGDIFFIIPYEPHAILFKQEQYSTLTICLSEKIINEQSMDIISVRVLKLLDEFINEGIISEQQKSKLMNNIMLIDEKVTTKNSSDDLVINDAKKILENAPERSLEIDLLAKQTYVSKYHLIRKFKQHIGLTPHYFQMQNRIRKSQQLLSEGESIAKVAMEAGFYDQSHFNKWFKRILGITPSEYIHACDELPCKKDG